MTEQLPGPDPIAAIDAGSNALRLVVARPGPGEGFEPLFTERVAVRLGHHVCTHHEFDEPTLNEAVRAFKHFRQIMEHHGVRDYRAVATSATREAGNRKTLLKRVQKESGIKLEVIDGVEEARLVRLAVMRVMGEKLPPRLILDLGGGSLEINVMKKGKVEQSLTLPIGTVRLMETFGVTGAITPAQVQAIRGHVMGLLRAQLPDELDLGGGEIVACGGNAEALCVIAPGDLRGGLPVIDVYALHEHLWQMLGLDVPERMKIFNVRRDRAEVMGVAALVFSTLGRVLNIGHFVAPGVGVREGVLTQMMLSRLGRVAHGSTFSAQALRASVREFATRFHYEAQHAEQVRRLSVSLYDQLKDLHKMTNGSRLDLELASLLHDIGSFISSDKHAKHGDYLIRHGAIAGVDNHTRARLAALVRFHTRPPDQTDQKALAVFPPPEREELMKLLALLRIADGLDHDHRQCVKNLVAKNQRGRVEISLQLRSKSRLALERAQEKAHLFETLFGRKVVFKGE